MKKTSRISVFLFLIAIFFSRCGNIEDINRYAGETTKTNSNFYRCLQEGNISGATSMFSSACLKEYPFDTLKKGLQKIHDDYGVVTKFELIENEVSWSQSGSRKQHKFLQTFKVNYSSGFIAKEEISYAIDGDKPFDKIDAYVFDFYNAPR